MSSTPWLDQTAYKKLKEAVEPKRGTFIDAVSKVIVTKDANPDLFKAISMLSLQAELIYKRK